ncbi:MAG: endonuclease/exonuclease/phosphatase family protein [Rhodothermales bacterium]
MRVILSLLLGLLMLSTPAAAQDTILSVRAMTFNVRYHNPDDGVHAWPHRADDVAATIAFWNTDVAGLQEVMRDQLDDLSARLPEYAWLGVGRDDGNDGGEFSPIFYKRERFAVVDHGTFWLSPTPDQVGSQGWDAALPRIATWARFRDKATDLVFLVLNTHFDHRGEEARVQSAGLLREQIQAKVTYGLAKLPVILMGDFNVTPDHDAYTLLTAASPTPHLYDTRHRAHHPVYGPEATFSGFTVGNESDRRIDYVFTSAEWGVERYGVLNGHRDGHYPSDHLPVLAELVWIP